MDEHTVSYVSWPCQYIFFKVRAEMPVQITFILEQGALSQQPYETLCLALVPIPTFTETFIQRSKNIRNTFDYLNFNLLGNFLALEKLHAFIMISVFYLFSSDALINLSNPSFF